MTLPVEVSQCVSPVFARKRESKNKFAVNIVRANTANLGLIGIFTDVSSNKDYKTFPGYIRPKCSVNFWNLLLQPNPFQLKCKFLRQFLLKILGRILHKLRVTPVLYMKIS